MLTEPSSGLQADINVSVDMRIASKMPHEGWAFNSPDVPDFVALEVAICIVRHVQAVEASALLKNRHDFFDVFFAVNTEQNFQRICDEFFLITT